MSNAPMLGSQVQNAMHKPGKRLLSEHSLKAIALAIKAGFSIASSDLRADASLQILPSGEHVGGTIKVIIAGLPRTGTMSMKKALEELGYKNCFHLAEPLYQPGNLRRSADIVHTRNTTERRRKLAKLFQGYEVTLEVPGSACLPDLLEMYPDAKVVLTERTSAKVWLKSWRGFGIDMRSDCFRILGYWCPGVVSANSLYRGWIQLASERYNLPAEPSEALYDAHSAWVKSIVPPGRLLVFKCQDGWTPLCKFLKKKRPNRFPHGNEASELRWAKRVGMIIGISGWLLIIALAYALMMVLRMWSYEL